MRHISLGNVSVDNLRDVMAKGNPVAADALHDGTGKQDFPGMEADVEVLHVRTRVRRLDTSCQIRLQGSRVLLCRPRENQGAETYIRLPKWHERHKRDIYDMPLGSDTREACIHAQCYQESSIA